MKTSLSIFLVMILCFNKQKDISGNYVGNHKRIQLNKDSTFFYVSNDDTSIIWGKGKWKCSNDTIYFTIVPIYDTIRITGDDEKIYLSPDTEANLITNSDSVYKSRAYQVEKLKKLFYKKDKLYEVDDNGKLKIKKEGYGMYIGLYYPWYTKMKE